MKFCHSYYSNEWIIHTDTHILFYYLNNYEWLGFHIGPPINKYYAYKLNTKEYANF